MTKGFRDAGARVLMFDNILGRDDADSDRLRANLAAARDAGVDIIDVSRILNTSPDRDRFLSLDHIHMTEPYHRLMAKQWLKALIEGASETRAKH
jgi:hypothetical protein